MADGYSWSELRDGGAYRLPGPQHLGWWSAVAMLLSLLLHVAVYGALDRLKIALHFNPPVHDLSTSAINVRPVPIDSEDAATPETTVTPPKDSATLLEEVD